MSRTDETRHLEWHETCKCKCTLDESVCNNKPRWNEDKCRCECRELIHKEIWDKDLCDKGKVVDKLVKECSEIIDGNKMTLMQFH